MVKQLENSPIGQVCTLLFILFTICLFFVGVEGWEAGWGELVDRASRSNFRAMTTVLLQSILCKFSCALQF